MRGLTGARSAGLQAVRHAWHAQAQTTCSGMLCCAHMPMRMHIHVCMLSSLECGPYEPSVLRPVAVMATRQQDAGSWKTLNALPRSESRLSTLRGSTHAIAQKPHAKWKTCHAHSCAWAWACHLQISIVAMCLETQFDTTSPKTTTIRDHLDDRRPRRIAPLSRENRPLHIARETFVEQFLVPFLGVSVVSDHKPVPPCLGQVQVKREKFLC